MREGSTTLGSLGAIPTGIQLLMLPLAAALAFGAAAPAPAAAAHRRSSSHRHRYHSYRHSSRRHYTYRHTSRRRASAAYSANSLPAVIHTRATWYGPGFHGHRTASGERFDRNAMTLASRHLPFGTRVRVVNLKNGRSAFARVNDRGPFGSRALGADLSQGLARRIGLRSSGPIRLEILSKKSAQTASAEAGSG